MIRKKIFTILVSFLMLALVISSISANSAIDSTSNIFTNPTTIPTISNGCLSGDITDRNGKPVDGAYVVIFPPGNIKRAGLVETKNGEGGHYFFADKSPGQYFVFAFKPFVGAAFARLIYIKSDEETQLSLSLGILPSGGGSTGGTGTIIGTITDKNGYPVDGASYAIIGTSAFKVGYKTTKYNPHPLPGYSYKEFGLAAGRYMVFAWSSESFGIAYPVYVKADWATRVDLSLFSKGFSSSLNTLC
jgi:hypothetical protein